jgi:hypothetical protein
LSANVPVVWATNTSDRVVTLVFFTVLHFSSGLANRADGKRQTRNALSMKEF